MAQGNNFKYPCLKFTNCAQQISKPLILLEASTGIEPVYTDLQSRKSASENNDLRVQNTP